MIVSFVQTKGGTGKSTLSLNLAFSKVIQKNFESVALIEFDPQGTLRDWWSEREENQRKSTNISFHHISSTQKAVVQDGIKSIAQHNELLILDTPGESTGKLHTKLACAISDLVVIPTRSSTNEEMALANKLLPILKEITRLNNHKKGTFQVLPAFVNTRSKKEKIQKYFEEILPSYIGCFPNVYPLRSIYENFNREGMTLLEYAKMVKNNQRLYRQTLKSIDDIEQIASSILRFLITRKS
ncbi:MAG: ParA family protein [SAR324 cluster bacterium]|nr:ParA family protein [SAR324 cluster bacterium]